jgi:hypothetical protein
MDRNLIGSVIERWRSATMSHKAGLDDDFGSPIESAPLQPATVPPAPIQSPSVQPAQAYNPQRSPLLKKPLEGAGIYSAPLSPRGYPPANPPGHTPGNPPGYPPRSR